MRVLGVVPARGGSKGIPRKNIRLLAGKPLLAYTAEAALRARRLARVILSTDDSEIAAVGRQCGLAVPFLRPVQLAEDATPTLDVLLHAVSALEQDGERYEAICLLQPTNPLRTAEHIDACIDRLGQTGADSVMTILPVPVEYNPHWVYFEDKQGFLRLSTGAPAPIPRRQELPAACHREGSVYVVRRDVLMEERSLYGSQVAGYPMNPQWSVNLDSSEDWARAETLLALLRAEHVAG